jgi:tetratricopeptide (TPR) repeat protein
VTDFFISYTQADRPWAEWISWVLEEAGHKARIQAWDFRPGGNFVMEMQKAAVGSDRTIAVLSPDYLRSMFAMAEGSAAFVTDPDGTKGKLVPILVREVDLESLGLLAPIIQIHLVGLGESAAREALVNGLVPGRVRPESVRFPGAHLFPGRAAAPPDPKAADDTLAALPLEEVPLPDRLPMGSRMPLASNPLFVGREEDLKTLASQLKAGETSAVGQVEIAAATGLGGIGKTQLASEFVHRYGRFFAGGVFWMSFASGGTVPIEVAACGQSLGLHSSFDALTLEQQVRLVEAAWQSPLPRLLVFDNCEEEELLHRWRPRFGGARVLVTSRRSEWDATLNVKTVPITTLPRPASIELLRRFRPDVAEEDPVLDAIAGELGDLPLALHLAGSFLKSYRNSVQMAAYLDQLRRTDLLDHPSLIGRGAGLSPTRHEAHVGRTFALSFERLEPARATDALAVSLLVRAAWFAPGEPIPRSLLLQAADIDSADQSAALDGEDAIRLLTDLGLLEVDDRSDPLMHRLVAAWARGVTDGDQGRVAVEEMMVAEATRLNEIGNPAPLRAWQSHLRVVTDLAADRKDAMAARLCDKLGVHLWRAGDYSGARPYLEEAVALHETASGLEHPETARSLNNLGCLLLSQADYSMARATLERGLEVLEKVLGPEHPDTARSLNDLGVLLYQQGAYEGARVRHERALVIREKVLGPEHPDIALSLENLGSLLQRQGNLRGARPYCERALAIREKVLGPKHPHTANSLDSFATLLQDQGDFAEARLYFEKALAITEQVLSPEHPDIATRLSTLGGVLNDLGDLAGARRCAERALAIQEKVLGLEHPITAKTHMNLGSLNNRQGNLAKARWYWEKAMKIFNSSLGPHHPDMQEVRKRLSTLPGARRLKKQRSKKKP